MLQQDMMNVTDGIVDFPHPCDGVGKTGDDIPKARWKEPRIVFIDMVNY